MRGGGLHPPPSFLPFTCFCSVLSRFTERGRERRKRNDGNEERDERRMKENIFLLDGKLGLGGVGFSLRPLH